MRRPNVLVILSDEHNPAYLGCAGHPLARTPCLDALAARGTTYSCAYTPSPICVPARASLATGRYVHDIGYWDNAIAYDGRVRGWGHAMQDAGIRVESIGKLHYRNSADATGFDRQIEPMHILNGIGQVWGSVRDPLPARQDALAQPPHPLRRQRRLQDLDEIRHPRRPEGRAPVQDVIEDAAEPEDVRRLAEFLRIALDLLGRHEAWSAEDAPPGLVVSAPLRVVAGVGTV